MITVNRSLYNLCFLLLSFFSIIMAEDNKNQKEAVFAAGCFWGVESTFQQLEGVKSTSVGYTGGKVKNPSYELVCTGLTDHAEAVQIVYDETVISYEQLLDTFFELHDPTTLDRQGPDVGSQYRSAVFYKNEQEKTLVDVKIGQVNESGKFRSKVVTEVAPLSEFYDAEDYHQDYYKKRGIVGCAI
jgi:peptide-methionine (S)-S-oxide reductase|tara:strand:+ start:2587 stop:3144 length:558 start_codon:yes stop_codon:yes gene_type:complete